MLSFTTNGCESSEDEVSDRIRRRSTINIVNQRQRNFRHIRLKIYNFLEKPLNAASAPYHFLIFGLVLINIIFGAATSETDSFVALAHYILEVFLVIFFILEFILRLWSIKADAKYRRKWGRIYYLFQNVTIIDLCIIPSTILLLVFEGRHVDGTTLDTLRFIQILRLFHVDRQMAAWKLLRKMILLSKWHLLAAYYITLVLGISMATIIYTTESLSQGLNDAEIINAENGTDATFPTMAHSWWFTVVTVLTIGYGDIVPSGSFTKIIVCVMGFLAFCTFQAANTQISVGMTLMMEEENKQKCQKRLRNIAASTIQTWWRYYLATNWKPHRRYIYFTHVCYKLYVTEERLNQNRALAQKLKEKLEKKKSQKKKQISHQTSIVSDLRNSMKTRQERIADFHRRTRSEDKRSSLTDAQSLYSPVSSAAKNRLLFAEKQFAETSISSSFDLTEVNAHLEVQNMIDDVGDVNLKDVDIKLLMKYRPLLRFFNFVMFRFLIKKFRSLRKAGELLTIEAEIAERENSRNSKMKELEATIISLIGKPTISPFDCSGNKLSLIERVEFCEDKMSEIELKVEEINETCMKLLELIEVRPIRRGLPPLPSRKAPVRQSTIPEKIESEFCDNNEETN